MIRKALALFTLPFLLSAQRAENPELGSLNKPERLEWFRDLGFGLFIHWSVDSQLGVVISHSMAGASDDYNKRFLAELPKTFNPRKFNPSDWAALAKLAGIRYVVFTAKHHSGFAMWDTKTTPYGIMNTPFKRDTLRETLDAFKAHGIRPGLYFSPDDFNWLVANGKDVQRNIPGVAPANNPGLMRLDLDQTRELLTQYGPIDIIFFDGPAEGLRDLAWKLQPDIVVTRGAIQTPELYVPGVPLPGAWETCFTMGTAWQYQPQNEQYKSGGQVIDLLVETRAKGGNLLLNVGPKPDGELPIEQEERLREVALWMFVNSEAIYSTRPWVITNENNIWFTKAKDANTLYAIVKQTPRWPRAEWRDFVLKSVRATPQTEISVVGQNGRVLEYRPTVNPKPTFEQRDDGLHLRAMFTHRLQDNSRWPNPIVIKLTNVQPAFTPPKVETTSGVAAQSSATLRGSLIDMGGSPALTVGFQYRNIVGLDASDRSIPWQDAGSTTLARTGPFEIKVEALKPDGIYEYRAYARHPLLTIYGAEKRLTLPR